MAFSLPEGFWDKILNLAMGWIEKSLEGGQPVETVRGQFRSPGEVNRVRLKLAARRAVGLNGLRNKREWEKVETDVMSQIHNQLASLTDQDIDLVIENANGGGEAPIFGGGEPVAEAIFGLTVNPKEIADKILLVIQEANRVGDGVEAAVKAFIATVFGGTTPESVSGPMRSYIRLLAK